MEVNTVILYVFVTFSLQMFHGHGCNAKDTNALFSKRDTKTGEEGKQNTEVALVPKQTSKDIDTLKEHVAAAPSIVAHICHLMVLSSGRDFPLGYNEKTKGYKHIQYPNSFRATIVQLSNVAWKAFYAAQQNIFGMALEQQNLPIQFSELLTMANASQPEQLRTNVKSSIDQIAKIALKCKEMSKEISAQFKSFQELLAEVLTAVTSKKDPVTANNNRASVAKKPDQQQLKQATKVPKTEAKASEKTENQTEGTTAVDPSQARPKIQQLLQDMSKSVTQAKEGFSKLGKMTSQLHRAVTVDFSKAMNEVIETAKNDKALGNKPLSSTTDPRTKEKHDALMGLIQKHSQETTQVIALLKVYENVSTKYFMPVLGSASTLLTKKVANEAAFIKELYKNATMAAQYIRSFGQHNNGAQTTEKQQVPKKLHGR